MLQPIPLVSGGSAANRPCHAALQLDGGSGPLAHLFSGPHRRRGEISCSSAGRGADASDNGAADFGGKGPRLPPLRLVGPALLSPPLARPTPLSPGPRGDWGSAGGGADPAFSPAAPAVSSAQQRPLTLPAKRPAAVVVLEEEEYLRAGVGGSTMRRLLSSGQQAAAGRGDGSFAAKVDSEEGGGLGWRAGSRDSLASYPFRSSPRVSPPAVDSGHGWVAWAVAGGVPGGLCPSAAHHPVCSDFVVSQRWALPRPLLQAAGAPAQAGVSGDGISAAASCCAPGTGGSAFERVLRQPAQCPRRCVAA